MVMPVLSSTASLVSCTINALSIGTACKSPAM